MGVALSVTSGSKGRNYGVLFVSLDFGVTLRKSFLICVLCESFYESERMTTFTAEHQN